MPPKTAEVYSRIADITANTMPIVGCLTNYGTLSKDEQIKCVQSVQDRGPNKMSDDVHYLAGHLPREGGHSCDDVNALDKMVKSAASISQTNVPGNP
jgi:hypothetical protein